MGLEGSMTHLFFHCTNADEALLDRAGRSVADLRDAHEHAIEIARTVMIHASGLADFRDWLIHVADEDGEEIMLVPFAFAKRQAH
jgi:hypothetical protein